MMLQAASYLGSALAYCATSTPFVTAFPATVAAHSIMRKIDGDDMFQEDPVLSTMTAVPLACLSAYATGQSLPMVAAAGITALALEYMPTYVGLPANAFANGATKLGKALYSLWDTEVLLPAPQKEEEPTALVLDTKDKEIEVLKSEIAELRKTVEKLEILLSQAKPLACPTAHLSAANVPDYVSSAYVFFNSSIIDVSQG